MDVEQPQPKLGAWRDELDRLLAANAAGSSRERVTLLRIYEDLRGLGYQGGYDAVRRYASSWRRRGSTGAAAAFVPLSFEPGEAYQFDWSHEVVLIDGGTVTVKVAHMRLCHSRMPFVRAYPRETQEMVFDRARPGLRLLQGRLHARDLRQHGEDRGGRDLCGEGAGLQPPVPADVRIPEHPVARSGDIRSGVPGYPVTPSSRR